ncbi:type I-C CRISPR-associated endonuclease Cas1c [Desulfurispirillum indicum]|uniref:type I-C CRISPR-associated endonuclease Cas1c n=1 Tax=Desulfurispirillum indicum TaxID=936456 RepID=UPI001CFA0C03|nr:type I-C CRISPR-associated endonuclease Cas1c [Desulfurispirillum indicum]UCZ57495.1 type I-C CRISPR-associated endonuclease Cas1c [Desulfurispirillum indicum]
MKQILNTLYVQTQDAYLHLANETVSVKVSYETKMRVPLHHLACIVTIGKVSISPYLMGKCAEVGIGITILDHNGKFQCRVVGKTTGNVLLRHAQFSCAISDELTTGLAKTIVAGKIKNSRTLLLRGARESECDEDEQALRKAAAYLAASLQQLNTEERLDGIRGIEGDASRVHFEHFDYLVKPGLRCEFPFEKRTRRPPLNRMNALLSFLYTLVANDCTWALEGVGLDPQVGFLHAMRPGRTSLGLDLMEEFRAPIAEKIALTLVNRRQISLNDFEERPGGAVWLDENGRRTVIGEYQSRKQNELKHPLFKEKIPIGLLPHIQARLLARHLRGESEYYTPMVFL